MFVGVDLISIVSTAISKVINSFPFNINVIVALFISYEIIEYLLYVSLSYCICFFSFFQVLRRWFLKPMDV